ncbi:nitrate ABC transporter permease [Salinisphaera orenii MK-B5]|uniref:Nitrate ABC transporter permease n=1 Tax=Salinisphaera orenii MK-B5 TaxID=856730 RepID=A0A423PY11_9GAMM|nr:ABC transporter permease [Salinisphaera orenii]ROO30474.1 nitrate ABC transporter permease [Salinisphaera orenii MK-B5]
MASGGNSGDARGSRALLRIGLGALGVAAFVALWDAAYVFNWAPRGTLPDPFAVPGALLAEWRNDRLLPAVGSSLVHYVWGLGVGTVLGFGVGLLSATSRVFDDAHYMLARILRPIPPLAWVVFAIAWFQVSHAGAAFVISIGVFWVNYFATAAGVRDVDPRYYELARAFGHGGFIKRVGSVTLPGAAPGILSGMRTGVGQAWMTLIAAELLGVPGMGQEMNAAAGVGAYDAVVVYMLAISLIYTLSDGVFALIEKRLLRWRP